MKLKKCTFVEYFKPTSGEFCFVFMKILLVSLAPFLKKYKWYLFWGIIFIVISNFFSIYPAQLVRKGFDALTIKLKDYENASIEVKQNLKTEVFQLVIIYALGILASALLKGVFLYGVRQAIIVMSRHIEFEQKNQLFEKILSLSQKNLKKYHTGDFMARLTEDIGNVRMFTGPGIMYSINTITLFFMVLITMLYVNWELTLMVMLPLPLLSYLIYFVHKRIVQQSEVVQAELSAISSYTQEVYSGIRTVRAYNKENLFYSNFLNFTTRFKEKSLNLAKIDAFFFPIIQFLIGLSTILAVGYGGMKVFQGHITVGNIAEFIMYVYLLTWPIASLGWVTSLTQKAAVSQERINTILNIKPDIQYVEQSQPIQKMDIDIQNVTFVYEDSGIKALDNLSLTIQEGQSIGIVGATGSGKTTLFALLTRLYDPQNGSIIIDNQELKNYTNQEIRNNITIVPQDVFLFSDTIENNIRLGKPEATEEEIIEAAKFAAVYEDIMVLPKQFKTVVGERGVTLSGGQKQRIAIARAYLKKAKLLLLDDCLSAVDTLTEEKIIQKLQNIPNQKITLIIASHRLSIMPKMDKIIVLKDGKIIESGTHEELLQLKGQYAKLYYAQN